MKKGISPLVAAVLLIAVTMTIAGMLAYWASSFVRTQTETFENQTVTGACNYANFRIYSCFYNQTSGKLNLILENIQTVELTDLRVNIIYPNASISTVKLNSSLGAGTLQGFSIDNIPNFTKIVIKTQCPELSRESSCR